MHAADQITWPTLDEQFALIRDAEAGLLALRIGPINGPAVEVSAIPERLQLLGTQAKMAQASRLRPRGCDANCRRWRTGWALGVDSRKAGTFIANFLAVAEDLKPVEIVAPVFQDVLVGQI